MAASFRARITNVLTLAALLALPLVARAAREPDSAPATRIWVTDSWVRAVAVDQGTVYVGGYFKVIAPHTGGGAVVDLDRGDLATPSGVDGSVFAAVPDGGGGWFIGGEFSNVGGEPRRNLAHIDRAGRVSDWTADVAGAVSCMVLESGRLFVGGLFSSITGVPRNGLAAVDPRTGAVLEWNAFLDGSVLALAPHGGSLFVGGRFLAVRGASRPRLAAVDVSSGALLPWNPDAHGEIYALAVASGTVFIGGEAMTIGGASRTGLAAVDARTGALQPWHPRLSKTEAAFTYVSALAVRGSRLYFSGFFDQVDDFRIRRVAAVDIRSGAPLRAWNPEPGSDVVAIAVRGDVVYLGGDFRGVGGVPRNFVAAVDATDGHVLPWDPQATNSVRAIALQANTAYLGGPFEGVGGRARPGIAAIDAESGRITEWNPVDSHFYVPTSATEAIVAGNGRVFAAGGRNLIGGQSLLVWAFDATAGSMIDWGVWGNDGEASTLALHGNTLYLGGFFDGVFNGVTTVLSQRRGLAAVDATTSRLLPWDPAPYRDSRFPPAIDALVAHDSGVYVGGIFTQLGGVSRSLLGEVDAATGASTDWVPAPGHWGKAIAVTDGRVFTAMPRHVSALDARTGAELWDVGANGSMDALAVGNGLLFAAGTFETIDDEARRYIAALDPATGQVTPWNPGVDRIATELAVSGDRLFGVGNFGVYSVPLPGSTLARSAPGRAMPARPTSLTHCAPIVAGEARLTLAIPEPGPVSIGVFDLQGRRIASVLDHAWLEAGTHEQSIRTTDWPRGLYFVRVDLAGRTETHRVAVIR